MFGLFSNPISSRHYAQCLIDEINSYIKTGAEPFLGMVNNYLQSVDQKHRHLIHREIFLLLAATTRFYWIDQQYAVFKVAENIKATVLREYVSTIKSQWGDEIVEMYDAACNDYNEPIRLRLSAAYHDNDENRMLEACTATCCVYRQRLIDAGCPEQPLETFQNAVMAIVINYYGMHLAKKHNYKQVRV